jgi:hypothetical protein
MSADRRIAAFLTLVDEELHAADKGGKVEALFLRSEHDGAQPVS